MNKIGFSKDIHILVPNRKLILAGEIIPFEKGEEAHSDGDVVYHALGEAILGALALGDLGKYFPPSDPQYKDMDSSIIINKIYEMMVSKGFEIGNIDIMISLEKPKLKDYILKMRENVSRLLHTNINNVSIKAGTNEGCGEVGKGEAVEAYAIVLLNSKE